MLALFAVITGARSLKDFTAQLVTTNAELGRLGRNLNISPQTLSAWGAAAERLGGTADATIASFERVSKSLYDLQRNAQLLPKEFSQLQALTGVKIDPYHGVDKFMRNTAAALKEMAAIDPAQAHFLAQGLGIDDATANAMIKYGDGIGAYIANLKRLSPSDAEDLAKGTTAPPPLVNPLSRPEATIDLLLVGLPSRHVPNTLMRVLSSRIDAPIYQGTPTNRIPVQASDRLRGEDGGDNLRFELLSPGTHSICVSEQQRTVNIWQAGQTVRIESLTAPYPDELTGAPRRFLVNGL